MVKFKGNLLLRAEGLEVAHIQVTERDRAVQEFYDMKTEAERHGNRFYILQEVYEFRYSYGFYPYFQYVSWPECSSNEYLKGISQNTYQLMHSFCQCPGMEILSGDFEFYAMDKPHACTGYSNPSGYHDFVGNLREWEKWHTEWFTEHPNEIDWNGATNDFLPRQDRIVRILKRELGEIDVDLLADADVVNLFYDRVMRHKGDEIEAYASKIGHEVCAGNYYRYEQELSALEQSAAGNSLRKIFSIVNQHEKEQFISIDFKHGMFEFHNEKGDHLGEFRFDGSPNSCADPGHSLRCVKLWRRRYKR